MNPRVPEETGPPPPLEAGLAAFLAACGSRAEAVERAAEAVVKRLLREGEIARERGGR